MPRFSVFNRRWVVERTITWTGRNRPMSKDYEFLPENKRIVYLCGNEPINVETINKGVSEKSDD
jgi:transposase